MAADEILDVVDEQDRVIGQKPRSELYAAGQKNFRVVNAFIEDARGLILIPRRSQERKMFPGALDTSVGGHVLAGEDYLDALVRETREECGLDLLGPDASYRLVKKLSPYESPVSAFMHFYLIQSRVEPQLCDREFSGFEWTDPEILITRLKPGREKWKDDLPALVHVLLAQSTHR
jgi:isopentenyldiphosphate isomerase